jgi:hypothetical protein
MNGKVSALKEKWGKEVRKVALGTLIATVLGALLGLGVLTGCAVEDNPDRVKISDLPTELPVAPGEVSPWVENVGAGQWAFSVKVGAEADQERAISNLQLAGFEVTGRSDFEGATNVSLTKGTIKATLKLTKAEDGSYLVIYNVLDTAGGTDLPFEVDQDGNVVKDNTDPAEPDESTTEGK